MLDKIEQVTPEADYKIRLVYQDGETVLVDFATVIQEGGIFSALADPEIFRQVKVGERGRSIVWPGDLDFCADALRLQGQVVSPKFSSAA